MAEVVGAVAAIVQFVDVALRLSSCLERFCSDVRNVPRRFLQLQTDLRQQIEIAQQIQNHRLPGFATAVASSTFNTPLVEYIGLAEELCKTLEALLARKNDGVFQRGWDAICSVRKKEEVASICNRLEQKKSTLSLWLEAANLKLASNITVIADQTRLDVGTVLTLLKTVDGSSNTIATNTAQLHPHVEEIDRNLATTCTRTERILQDTQRLLTAYDADVTAQESNRKMTAMNLANTEQILAAIEKLTMSPGTRSPHAQPGYVTDHVYVGPSADQPIQRNTVYYGCRPQRCKCRTVGTARRWQPLSRLRFTRTFRTQHFSYCPDYRTSEQSLEIAMQIVPPSWLLYRTIDFGTRVRNWSTLNQFSISPIVIGTSQLVDSQTSPAFRAVWNTWNEIIRLKPVERSFGQHHMMTQLHKTLQRIFDNAEASVMDVASDGRTVLNEIVRLFVGELVDSSCVAACAPLFQYLVDRGANPNVIRDSTPYNSFEALAHHGGTTCDQLMDPMLFYMGLDSPTTQGLRTILELFLNAGGHTSKPFTGNRRPGDRCTKFHDDVLQLSLFEDQIDIMDLGDLVPIILQRQEEHFHRIIAKAEPSIFNRRSPINGLAPIHFAVLWPNGLRILVERGADLNIEDDYGRRPVHLAVALQIDESVRCLLNADCGLFTPAEDYSLLQYAITWWDEDEDPQLLLQLIQALCDRHTRLRDLANSYLPPSVSAKLVLTPGELQEQRASLIMETLLSHGVDIPPALELDRKGFYDFFEFHGGVQITPRAANALWSVGFHEIDEPNDNGWTPFLQSWFCHNFDMIDWFASRGVRLDSRHTDVGLTALHLYAKGMRHSRTAFKNTSALEEQCIESIQKKLGIPKDDCACTCSPNGCTPAKFVLEREDDKFSPSQRDLIRLFIENLNPPKPLLNQYIYNFTRHILFDFLGGEHTCCALRQERYGEWELSRPTRKNKWRKQYRANWHPGLKRREDCGEHFQYCKNGLPIPRLRRLGKWQTPDVFNATFEAAISRYDEMHRPDAMPAEEQVFDYIRWILKKGYLDIDVSDGCEHDDAVLGECAMSPELGVLPR